MKTWRALAGFILFIILNSCSTEKKPQKESIKPVDLVYPLLDSENSRWFFFSSACRPFGMVNLNPDTQIGGAWGSGYRYNTDTVKGFSHIHAWQLSGLSVMPVVLVETKAETIFTDFYSAFPHESEKVSPGYHYLELKRFGITAELTSTKRVGFHKYTFPEKQQNAILFNLNTLLGPCKNTEGTLEKVSAYKVVGKLVNEPTRRRPKPVTVFFQVEFDQSINNIIKDKNTGNYLVILEDTGNLLMKAGLSYTSVENASENIKTELPHWDFNRVVKESEEEWDSLLGRIQVEGGSLKQQKRFYTDLWHALQGRRIISDTNGSYPDYTGDKLQARKLPLDENGKPAFNHYNSDAFWGAQWTLNTLWGIAYPEIYREFVQSLMLYYKDGGMIPRGPSGGNYTYVMTGSSATPFIVSALQKGIVNENLKEIYNALKKNHMPKGIMSKAGYEHDTYLGGGLGYYMSEGYVPYPIPEGKFGYHQDGASLTMEYAYQDWTLAQLAKKLGYVDDYNYFLKRSENYKNVFDHKTGWMRPKDVDGNWYKDFDPYQYEHGFNESNSAQSTWFVPHNLTGLAKLMGGNEKAVKKLVQQFETASSQGFTAGTSHDRELHPEFSRVPINYGNQPSIQTAFIFNKLGRPGLTQYWSRQVVQKAFSGLSTSTGYNGDEDQGLMGSLAVLMKIGLFQMTGGTEENPLYELGSPIFDKITITLNPDFYPGKEFTIKTLNNSPDNVYIKNIQYNGETIDGVSISHLELVKGGELVLEMSHKQ